MDDPGRLLAAAQAASQRQVSLRGLLTIWRDQQRINRGFNRWTVGARLSDSNRAAISDRVTLKAVGPKLGDQGDHTLTIEARWPDRWRLDGDWFAGGPTLTIIDGPIWMSWSKAGGAITNFGDPHFTHGNPAKEMLDPAPLLRSDIAALGTTELDGRRSWHLKATPRDRQYALGNRWAWEHCIDDYELDVDREFGLVIGLTGRVSGKPAIRYRFDQLQFGIDLGDGLFDLVPPDGSLARDARLQGKPPPG